MTEVGSAIRTLIVEDDPVVADVNRGYVGRVPGFGVVGVARTGAEAVAAVSRASIDLVLLDFYLPDMSGLAVCQALRAAPVAQPVDIIAVTAARDGDTVRKAVAHGVVQYLIKPYSFSTFRDKLERYAAYLNRLAANRITDQHEVDRTLETLRGSSATALPKGLSPATYALVGNVLSNAEGTLSASEVAEATGLSRISARRYLEHLHRQGLAELSPRYGGTGRPEHGYRWYGPTGQ